MFQNQGEQNFHIFYYLLAGLDDQNESYYLKSATSGQPIKFNYLNNDSMASLKNIRELKEKFDELVNAMNYVAFMETVKSQKFVRFVLFIIFVSINYILYLF